MRRRRTVAVAGALLMAAGAIMGGWPAQCAVLTSHGLRADIDNATGMVVGLTDVGDGRRLLQTSPDRYALQPEPDSEILADEAEDVVQRRMEEGGFVATNPKLPGIIITKRYTLTDDWLSKRVEFRATAENIGLLKYTVTATVDPEFYRDGYLNDPARHPLDYPYIFTRDLKAERPIRDSNALADHHFAVYTCPSLGRGLAQYRLRVDDRYVPLLTSYSYEPGLTYGPRGWRIAVAAKWMSRDRPSLSAETRWQRFRGDHLAFHQAYLRLHEVQEAWKWKTPAWVQRVQVIERWSLGTSSPRVERFRPLVEALDGGVMLVMVGGVFHNTRDYLLDPLSTPLRLNMPAASLRRVVDKLHAISPNIKVGPLTWQWGFGDLDPVYRQHAEWTVHDGQGNPVFAATGWQYEKVYSQLLTPECREHNLRQFRGMMDRYDFDFIYMDTGQGAVTRFDWNTKWGAQDYDWTDFYCGIREAARSRRDGMTFFNGAPRLYSQYADCGYFEGMGFVKVHDWRAMADRVLLCKLYQPDGKQTIPLYWLGDNREEYINYCYLLGLKPGGFGGRVNLRRWPMVEAANEICPARLVPGAAVTPCWWREYGGRGPQAETEAYALRIDDGALLNLYYHGEQLAELRTSCLVAPLGLAPNRPIQAWLFRPMAAAEVEDSVRMTPRQAHDIFRRTSRAPHRIMRPRWLGAVRTENGRVSLTVPVQPQRVALVLLTQAPRLEYAADGRPHQLLLPTQRRDPASTLPADQPLSTAFLDRWTSRPVNDELQSPLLAPPAHSTYALVNHDEKTVKRDVAGIHVQRLLSIDCEHNSADHASARIDNDGIHLLADMGVEKLDGFASAGIESDNLGRVRLRLTLAEPLYKRFAVNTPSCFIGLVADYHLGDRYRQRVRFALAPCGASALQSERPWWGMGLDGAASAPQRYVDLRAKAPVGAATELTLDLGKYAPAGWNGRVLFGVALESCGLGSRVEAVLTGNAPPGPRDSKAFSPLPVVKTPAGGALFQGAHIVRFEDQARLVEHVVRFIPNACIESTALAVTTWRIEREAASKQATMMINYQTRDGAYHLVLRDISKFVQAGQQGQFDLDLRQFAPDNWTGRTRIRLRGDHFQADLVANSSFQIF